MTYHQLGQKGPAEEMLGRLQETVKKPLLVGNEQQQALAQAFLREAEALLQKETDKSKK
jgi:hypothetical protein